MGGEKSPLICKIVKIALFERISSIFLLFNIILESKMLLFNPFLPHKMLLCNLLGCWCCKNPAILGCFSENEPVSTLIQGVEIFCKSLKFFECIFKVERESFWCAVVC